MTLTFEQLYKTRCKNEKPYYWKPKQIASDNYSAEDSGISDAISRILIGAELFEVDVRQYVSEVFRSDRISEVSPIAKSLLLSNIADESVHAAQFRYALDAYPVNSDMLLLEAESLSEAWKAAEGHPLQKAALLEVGVFVSCSLALLLRCGGHSLAWVSRMVALDEQRHVATNLGILQKLGYNPFFYGSELQELRKQTIDWIAGDLKICRWGIDKDWFIRESDNMVREGRSPALTALTSAHVDAMPFENSNKYLVY